ncbi:MAG TPA: GNAT family N-acetyltransferase, partial [Bacillota bacterium]|nr:GNAT family N-acetyltransferase [Bacillota bacterium]
FRRQGFGTLLLDRLIQEGIKKGARFFTLEVSSENQAAIRLYERFGFRETGRRKNYYKNSDAVLMTLDRAE